MFGRCGPPTAPSHAQEVCAAPGPHIWHCTDPVLALLSWSRSRLDLLEDLRQLFAHSQAQVYQQGSRADRRRVRLFAGEDFLEDPRPRGVLSCKHQTASKGPDSGSSHRRGPRGSREMVCSDGKKQSEQSRPSVPQCLDEGCSRFGRFRRSARARPGRSRSGYQRRGRPGRLPSVDRNEPREGLAASPAGIRELPEI